MRKYLEIIFALIIPFYMFYCGSNPANWHFIDNANLIFHEAGHTIFFFLPEMGTIMAGSIFQIVIPLSIAIYFFLKKDYIPSAITLSWIGQSIINVSVYAKDAIVMQLPLLGGENVIHDFNYIFTNMHIIKYTEKIGSTIYLVGIAVIISSIISILYIGYKKHLSKFVQ